MKKYFKKFGIMFVMLLAVIGVGMIQNVSTANAADGDYVLKKDYSQNLVANYKFEETSGSICVDSTKNYNGTNNGTTSTIGADGNARSFNGTSDYISFGNKVIPTGKKSIQFKIKTTSTSNNMYLIDNSDGETGAYGICITMVYGKIGAGIDKGTSGTPIFGLYSKSAINDGNWHTVLLTWDGTVTTNSVKLYIDGKLESSATPLVTETKDATYNLCVGKPAHTSAYYFEGQLDEIEIYNDVVEYGEESITLDKSTMDLNVGDSGQLTATTTPAAVGVTWKSSDSSIATVDSTGKVTGVKEGTCIITASTADGLTATCAVTVTPKGTNPIPTPEPTDTDKIVNIAHAKGDNTNNPGGDVIIIFHGEAETTLSVVKTADVKEVWVGDTVTYSIVVTNTGSKTAKAVVVNDPAPNHIDFNVNAVTTTQGTVDSSSTSKNIVVNVGDIPPAGIVTITIPATVIA